MLQRLIKILIFSVISISCFSQTSSLKNGFVAATDSGVYYLQDGFSEWMRLGGVHDTITSISFSYNSTSYASTSNDGTTMANIYGRDLLFGNNSGWSTTGNQSFYKNSTNKLKYKRSHFMIYEIGSTYWNFNSDETTFFGDNIPSQMYYFTSLDTDMDSIVCFTGTQNTLIKIPISPTLNPYSFSDYTIVSGLHSRSTDSHSICYNPDQDEFIIVSDSGIIYTYDKTTLTTIDTLDNCVKVDDICYGGGYVYISARYQADTNGSIYISSNLSTWVMRNTFTSSSDAFYSCAYSDKLDKALYYTSCSTCSGLGVYSSYSESNILAPIIIPQERIIYDLEYINYLP